MKNLPCLSKIALAIYVFFPWLLVVIFQFTFVPISWVSALIFIGPFWVFISPVFIYITVVTFANEAARLEHAKQASLSA